MLHVRYFGPDVRDPQAVFWGMGLRHLSCLSPPCYEQERYHHQAKGHFEDQKQLPDAHNGLGGCLFPINLMVTHQVRGRLETRFRRHELPLGLKKINETFGGEVVD